MERQDGEVVFCLRIGQEEVMFKTLIKYWRTSLADSDLTRIANQWKAVETMPSNLANGVVPLGLAEEIRSLLGMDSPRQDDLNIIIAPFVLQRGREAVSHGKIEKALGAKEIVPLLISAVLRTDNTISLDESKVWIPREFLEPSDGNNVYGAVDDFDAYILNKLPHRDEGWVDYQHIWNYAVGMAKAVFECEYGNAGNFDGIYSVSENLRVYALMEKKITATTKLIELYDFILHRVEDKGKIPDLLRLCSPICWPIHKSPISDSDIKNVVAKHVASMHANYPLSLSQRQSLIHCTEAGYGEVICINGPPGTGKTTLLQSVIATEWAASAIAGNNEPPLILATSTNNQAVTNIIEAFKARPGYRWLPEIEGFGLWFPSKKKMNESMGFLHVSHTNPDASNGLYRLVHNAVFFRKAEQQMLLACSTEEKKEAKDIKYVLDVVKRRLKILDNDLRNIFTLSKEINEATKRITSICGNEPDLYLRNLISDKETAEQNLSEIGDCRQSWLSILESEPWVLKFFGRLGLLNNKRKERIKLAISYFPRIKQYEQEIKWVSLLRGKDDSLIESLQMAEEQIKANLSPILSEIATINKLLEKRKDNKKNLCALFKKYGSDIVKKIFIHMKRLAFTLIISKKIWENSL